MKEDFRENDDLWKLLGKARHREASPFFARNVVRQIRQAAPDPKPVWFLPRWLAPASFAAIIVGFAFTLVESSRPNNSSMTPELAEYFDKAARLDQLAPTVDFTPAHLAGL
jgi:hypothetical protein